MIRIILPPHLRTLANVDREIKLPVPPGPLTQRSLLDVLESQYPMLRGTIRDHVTKLRRPMIRFFVAQQDLSLDSPDAPLPEAVCAGTEQFLVIGAMAGG